jgi:hydrogenase nickel incorporation protein HypB
MCDSCGCGPSAAACDTPASEHHHRARSRRLVDVRASVLSVNDRHAAANRARFAAAGTRVINLIGAPGSGKTTLLEATLAALGGRVRAAVIEGDLQTDRDAARIRRTGTPAHQINTGEACHLDAHAVGHALEALPPPRGGVLFIENVGNLVCPAAFDLGETARAVVLSVAEGDDKVEKYPVAFRGLHAVVIGKVDLLPYVRFDVRRCRDAVHALSPGVEIFEVSATTGDGLDGWCRWVVGETG